MLNPYIKGISYYSGEALKSLISENYKEHKPRAIVKKMTDCCRRKDGVIIGLYGLKATGKTTAIYDTVKKLGDYDNTLLLTVEDNVSVDMLLEAIRYLSGFGAMSRQDGIKRKRIKYLFIDNSDKLTEFVRDIYYIRRFILNRNARSIVISGCDPFAFAAAGLERMRNDLTSEKYFTSLDTTLYPYSEAKKTYGLKFSEYLENSGILGRKLVGTDDLFVYFKEAVSDVLSDTLRLNMYNPDYKIFQFSEKYINRENIRSLAYNTIFDTLLSDDDIKNVLSEINTNRNNQKFTPEQIQGMTNYLINISVLGVAYNFARQPDISLPWLFYCKMPSVLGSIYRETKKALGEEAAEAIKRKLWKDTVIFNAENNLTPEQTSAGVTMGFYKEYSMEGIFDIAYMINLPRESNGKYDYYRSNRYLALIEPICTYNAGEAVYNSRAARRSSAGKKIINENLVGEYIIYRGKTKTFDGFSNHFRSKYKGADEIEKLCVGIQLINDEEFILNSEKFVEKFISDAENLNLNQ